MANSKARPGKTTSNRTVGKSEAREQFLPLVDELAQGADPVEITSYGKVVAVLISKQDYDRMAAGEKSKPARILCGLGVLTGDLKKGSEEIAAAFRTSIEKTATEL